MGHFALTDVDGGYRAFERFGRGALGVAGAQAQPFAVWLDDWSARAEGDDGLFPLRLRAAADGVGIDLVLEPEKPVVHQGDRGLSQKSAQPGNASYYYSFTRLSARGEVESAGATHSVRGAAWLDREWGSSALGADQTGWDWFALQLDDGRDLMLYRLRDTEGGTHPYSYAVLVAADGTPDKLGAADFELLPSAPWQGPRGAAYPLEWRVRVPRLGLDLSVRSILREQLHEGVFSYYEGAVDVFDGGQGAARIGRGYLEMTPY